MADGRHNENHLAHLYMPTHHLPICTKFEDDSFFIQKYLRGSQNFEIGSRDPGHAHLAVVLFSIRRRGPSRPSSVYIPNLKRISS